MNLTQWSHRVGIRRSTLYARKKRGLSVEEILFTPLRTSGRSCEGRAKRHQDDCVPRDIPETGHYLIRFILSQMKEHRITYKQMAKMSGVSVQTLTTMKRRGVGLLSSVEAPVNALGFNLLPVPKGDERYSDIHGKVVE